MSRSPESAVVVRGIRDGSPVIVGVTRQQVNSVDISGVKEVLDLIFAEGLVAEAHGCLGLLMPEYDKDPRPLVAIPEVRSWIMHLEGRYPLLPYFLLPEMHQLLMLCHVPGRHVGTKIHPDEEAGSQFLIDRAFRIYQMFKSASMDGRTAAKTYFGGFGVEPPDDLLDEFERQS